MMGGGFPLKREVNRCYCARCSEEIVSDAVEKMVRDEHNLPVGVKTPTKPGKKPFLYKKAIW